LSQFEKKSKIEPPSPETQKGKEETLQWPGRFTE